jgi:Domain of unknown function (DUF4190)
MSDFPPPGGGSVPPPPGQDSGPAPGWWQASDGNWYPPDQQPGYGAAYGTPAGYGYGYPAQAAASSTNGFAIASLICSVLAFLTCFTAVLGIIFGHVALSQIKRSGEGGRGLAIAGLIVGYLGILLFVVLIVALFALGDSTSSEFRFDDNSFGVVWR